MRAFSLLAGWLVSAASAGPAAQDPPLASDARAGGLLAFRQALLDATNDWSAVLVAAHPDGLYQGMALLLRRQFGVRVTVVIATRGEGGQNAVGPELGAALGEIRSEETRRSLRILDAGHRFLDLSDFGYCRSAAEALDHWRGYAPERRLGATLDELAPDLVLTPLAPAEPHGQKRAVFALLARVLRSRAARLPRAYHAAGEQRPSFVLDQDQPDRDRGGTYREAAFAALCEHRSQAHDRPFEEEVPDPIGLVAFPGRGGGTLFEGLPTLWTHEALIANLLDRGSSGYDVERLRNELDALPATGERERATSACIRLLDVLRGLAAAAPPTSDLAGRLATRIEALERAVRLGTALALRWTGRAVFDRTRREVSLPLEARNGGSWRLRLELLGLDTESGGRFVLPAEANRLALGRRLDLRTGRAQRLPLRVALREARAAAGEGELRLRFDLHVQHGSGEDKRELRVPFQLSRRVRVLEPLVLLPRPEARYLVPAEGGGVRLVLRVKKPRARHLSADLALTGPPGVSFGPEGSEAAGPIHLDLAAGIDLLDLPLHLRLAAQGPNPSLRPFLLRLDLVDTRSETLLEGGCRLRLDPVRVRVPRDLSVGILRGPDRTIEESLAALGVGVRALDPRALARETLDRFPTIVVDSRALKRRPELRAQVPRLLAYATRGGHLVVLYHKSHEFNADRLGVLLAPYPLQLGRERVTREDAPVRVLRRRHPLLNAPNPISSADWDGWVQERGLYFPQMGAYDERYVELLGITEVGMDEAEGIDAPPSPGPFAEQRGSLLYAETGKGSYVYCALVLHRQLRAFHAGAARLLVNVVTPPSLRRAR